MKAPALTGDREKASPRLAYQKVAAELRSLIIRGEFPPGTQLPVEAKLGSRFGVSRSTVREALRILSSQNLITTARGVNGGTFVKLPEASDLTALLGENLELLTAFDEVNVSELLEAREFLEVPAARLAAERHEAALVARLRSCIGNPEGPDRAHFFEGNRLFHSTILETVGNRLLVVMAQPIFNILRTRFLRDEASQDFWEQVDLDHHKIVAAIEAADPDLAVKETRQHLGHLPATYELIDRRKSR